MVAPHQYYPEFDSTEVDEVIGPLARFDRQIHEMLGSAPTCSATGADTRTAVAQWLDTETEQYPFQRIIRTFAAAAAAADPLAAFTSMFLDPPAVLSQWLERVESRLREVCTRPLVTAVNQARADGRLAGADAAQRYRDFVARSLATSFETVSGASFPVLRAVTRVLIRDEAESLRELCGRLAADRHAIAAVFGIEVDDRVVSCGFSAGDAHNRGRSVSVLEFESGRRLVYKPRDVSCEAAYDNISRELNRRFGTSLVAATVLERQRYGYVEYIESEDVSDMSEAFLYRSGELAAVLYLLNARDMHFENVVPTRHGPVPIDLETILHPARVHDGPTPQVRGNAYETIGQSIYGIGILPLVMVGKDDDAGHVDLGFLGDRGRGNSPFRTMHVEEPFTDRVRLVLRAAPVQERRTVVDALTEDDIHVLGKRMAAGFATVLRAVMAARDSWSELLVKAAAGVRVRYVHNPTALYAQTLRMTSGATAMDDVSVYVALLKRIAIASKTSSRAVVASEMRQLAVRDIPYFTVLSTGVDLHDGAGEAVGARFPESPIDRALAKAANLSEFELGQQLTLIHSAFSSRFPDNHLTPAVGTSARRKVTPGRGQGPLAALAARLADHLVATSLPDRFAHLPRTWIGPLASARADRPWPPGVLGYDLYTGRVGPALALAAAGRALGDRGHRALAGQIFSSTAEILADRRYEMRSVDQVGFGGYTGTAGMLFALAAAGTLLEEDGWIAAARGAVPLVLDQVRDRSAADPAVEVISGLAGVLSCVTAIGGEHADAAVAALTAMLTDALAAQHAALSQSGFAHGISGLIHTLSQACPRVPADQQVLVRSTLSDLFDRLQGFFDAREGNWFSNVATPTSFATGWCHGATGIAMGLSAYSCVSADDAVRRARDLAVGNVVRHGFGRNLTWCHGDLGNHDAVATIARTADPSLLDEVAGIEGRLLAPEVIADKLADRKSRYAHTSSLMVGTAGVLLHLANRIDRSVHVSPIALTVESR